jgi:hypothetical protein
MRPGCERAPRRGATVVAKGLRSLPFAGLRDSPHSGLTCTCVLQRTTVNPSLAAWQWGLMEDGIQRDDTESVAKREGVDSEDLYRRAQVAVLSGLARGDAVDDLVAAAAPAHVPGRLTPDVALLELAVTALDLAYPAGAEPLQYEGLVERYLPEVTFRGRVEHRNSQYALYAAACMRGGLQPDLLSDAGWWQTPLWQYAVLAVVIYSRAATERLALPVGEVVRRIAARHGLELTA